MDNPFDRIPHVDFVPKTVDTLLAEMTADYEAEYLRQTGEKKSMVPSSAERIFLYTEAARFHTAYQLIDRGLKMNLLKYSEGDYLDNLAALFGLERMPAQPSVSRVRFTLSKAQARPVVIPSGTRISTPGQVFFATVEELVIPAGETGAEATVQSMDTGLHTAGLAVGALSILVDPVPFVAKVENTLSSQGGADIESDDGLRLRIYLLQDAYSVAGPEAAYRYFVRAYSQAVEGVGVYSPAPAEVDIRLTLTGGELPEQPFLDGLREYLRDKRPLTDLLTIGPPDIVKYDVDCTYYIAGSNRGRQQEIMTRVEAAVEQYLSWQGGEIGRDLNPDELTKLLVAAGAKRAPIAAPVFTVVPDNAICRHGSVNVVFGGMEDD